MGRTPTHTDTFLISVYMYGYRIMRPRIVTAAAITRSVCTHTLTHNYTQGQGISWSCLMLVASDKKLKYESFYHYHTIITMYVCMYIYPLGQRTHTHTMN